MPGALLRCAHERVGAGLAHLVAVQDADGLWRDYALKPGPSEGWTTAWIGWHLTRFAPRPACVAAVGRAVGALRTVRTPDGWGYNRGSETDADSTAWALRLIRGTGIRCGRAEGDRLARFIDAEGRVHTFAGSQHGTWAGAHADVTAMVGLALFASDPRHEALRRIRTAVIDAQRSDGLWPSFWWASDAYSSFWSVYFLRRTGGLPDGSSARVQARLRNIGVPGCALEDALWLLLDLELGSTEGSFAERCADHLLESSMTHGGWSGSPLLLVPKRFDGDDASLIGPHADVRGLMTTAVACWALARWVARAGEPLRPHAAHFTIAIA